MLAPRVILNRVYRFLTAELDAEQREKFDSELWAPPEGWDAAEARLWAAMSGAVGEMS